MAPIISPVKSFINIRSGMKSVISGLGALTTKTVRLNSILLRKTKVKRESIAQNYILSQRREESARRRDREDLIESSSIGGVFKRQAKAIASSTKGFLGRIMDFLGTLLVGWLMYNLPSIITMAQELIGRIQRLYTIATGFFNSTVNMFKGFGNVLGAIGKNILTFDFTDSKGRVNNAVKDLNGTFEDMQSQFDDAFKLLTTSLGEGIATGKNAQPFGTEYPNQSMQEQPSAAPSGTSGGRAVSGDSVDKKVLDFIADGEASRSDPYGGFNASRGKTQGRATDKTVGWLAQNAQGAIGRYQHMPEYILERAQASGFDANTKFTPEVQDKITLHFLKTSHSYDAWKSGKLSDEDFLGKLSPTWRAIPQGPKNAARLGGSPNSTYNDRYAGGNASKGTWDQRLSKLKSMKTGATQQERPTPRTPTPAQTSSGGGQLYASVGGQKIKRSEFGKRGFRYHDNLGSGASSFGHTGQDVPMQSGTPLSLVATGVVVEASTGWNGGFGNFVAIKLDDGRYIKLNHLSKILVKRGDRVGAGSGANGGVRVVGLIGSSGLSTGPHMHIDLGTGYNSGDGKITGLMDPAKFILNGGIVRGGDVKSTGTSTTPAQYQATPAQIASTGTQQRRQAPQNLAQNKPGPSIVIVEEDPPPAPQSQVSSGGGGGIIPIIINPLNSFITQKLLLDLAYT